MKIVLIKHTEFGFNAIHDVKDYANSDGIYASNDYVQISEIIDVDFPELSQEVIIKGQVAALDELERKEMAESEVKLTSIRRRKQELLALPELKEEDDATT